MYLIVDVGDVGDVDDVIDYVIEENHKKSIFKMKLVKKNTQFFFSRLFPQ